MLIRTATEADAAAILECMHAAFDPYRDRYTPGAFADTVPDSLEERFRTMVMFVAIERDTIIGTIACDPAEGHLRGMAVRPEWQGSGAARMLVDAAERELRERGCNRVTLDTTEPLARARCFYEKCGYSRTGRGSDFFGMPLTEYAKELEMQDVVIRRFEKSDDHRSFDRGFFDLLRIGGMEVGKAEYAPGWRWSTHVGAASGAQFCDVEHVGIVVSGHNRIKMRDGREFELKPGDVFYIAPGHDSWVVGNDPYVSLHLAGASNYAKKK